MDSLEKAIEQLRTNQRRMRLINSNWMTSRRSLFENRMLAIQYLQRGLGLVETGTDVEALNQARQYLAYLLFKSKHYRDATVVGLFLPQRSRIGRGP